MTARIWLVIVINMVIASQAMAQRPWNSRTPPPPERKSLPSPEADPEPLSDAERISRLQRGIDETHEKLSALRDKLNDPSSEYKKAESEFSDLDAQYESGRKDIQKLKAENQPNIDERETAQAELEKKRQLARERFDLAIKERKATQDQVVLLEQKVQQDREALSRIVGLSESKPAASQPEAKDAVVAPPQGIASEVNPSPSKAGDSGAPPAPVISTVPGLDANAGATPLAAPPSTATPGTGANGTVNPPSEKLVKAQETATSKQAEAEEARQEAASITQRLDSIRKVIVNEKELRRTAQQRATNAKESLQALDDEVNKKYQAGTPWAQLTDLHAQIDDAQKRVEEAEAEYRERGEILDARQAELVALQAEQIAALEEAKKKMEAAEAARAELAHLKNPFAPANVWHWVVNHAPKIGATILAAIVLLWFIQVMEHRMVRLITRHGVAGTQEDRESRARTLAGVLQNLFTVVVVVGAFLIVIAESGFNITTLLGATAVIGLAVAFGAQNLIRDYFYGFMILMENQYLVNDVVRLGAVSGQVERITLRITVLRDLRGTVHFVPHGQITTVSNLTRGWARVVLDVGVAYKEDVDRVMKVLADLGKEIRRDPAYRDLILDEPEISGVDALNDSAVVVRFLIKTRPLKQWLVKREMLRRIKNKFDEVGIEIPFPHQVVFNRFDADSQEQARLLAPPPPDDAEEWSTPRSAAS